MGNRNEFLRGKPADASGRRALGLFSKFLLVLAIAAGFQAAAQKFAHSVGYSPQLVGHPSLVLTLSGRPFPVYPFWRFFMWTLANLRHEAVFDYLYPAWKLAAYVSSAGILALLLVDFAVVGFKKQAVFGTARWAKKKDLAKSGLLQLKGGVILGQLAGAKVRYAYDNAKDSVVLHLKKPGRKITQPGIYNTNLSAPTRSGKGVSCVIPTLLSYPGSVIVLDFMGENFNINAES